MSQSDTQLLPRELTGWLGNAINWILFSTGVDVFRVYKIGKVTPNEVHKRARLAIHRESAWLVVLDESQSESDRLDLVRERWRKLLACVCYTLSSHLFVVGCIRLTISTIELTATLGRTNYPWLIRLARRLSDYVADPLAQSPRLAALIYFSIFVTALLSLVHLPARFARAEPFDSSAVRFILRPRREGEQLDMVMAQRLRSIESSIRAKYQQILTERVNRGLGEAESRLFWRLERQRQLVRSSYLEAQHLFGLRPPNFSPYNHQKLVLASSYLVALLLVGCIVFCGCVTTALVLIVLKNHSPGLQVSLMEPSSLIRSLMVLSWPEMLTLAETCAMFSVCAMGLLQILGAILLQSIGHLSSINAAIVDLENLLTLEHQQAPQDREDEELDRKLLQTLVRLDVFSQYARRSAATMTRLMSSSVTIALICCAIVVISRRLSAPDTQMDLQIPIICGVWGYNVALMLIVSTMPTRVAKMKRIVWSILARQACKRDRLHEPKQPFRFSLPDDHPLTVLWHKQVLNQYFIHDQHPVRALSIAMSHRQVLEINFLLLSFVSLMQAKA